MKIQKSQFLYGVAGILTVLSLIGSPLSARGSYIGGSVGLMSDLGNLGKTITVDGLDSALVGKPAMTGSSLGKGCSAAADQNACYREVPGTRAEVIVPENTLIAYEKLTGGILSADTGGSMTGLVLNLFYEYEWDSTFGRIGVAYNKKVMGGQTTSSVLGAKWLDITWDYRVVYVPAYFGIKTNMGEKSSVYGALGLNYHDGYFRVGGRNMGDIPTQALGIPMGATTARDASGNEVGGGLMYENATFNSSGVGFAVLLGVEEKLDNGDKWFIEVNHIFAGGQGTASTQDVGGIRHMTSVPVYPVTLNGTFFTMGYKKAV